MARRVALLLALLLIFFGPGCGDPSGRAGGIDASDSEPELSAGPVERILGPTRVARGGNPVDALEQIERRASGLEQRWRFDRPPSSGGTLSVEVPVAGALRGGATSQGVRITTRGAVYRYGHGTWIDASGARTHIPARWSRDHVRLEVSEALLDASSFPAWLDPVVSAERELGVPPIRGTSVQSWPLAVAWSGSVALFAFSDMPLSTHFNPDFFVRRTDAHGVALDPAPRAVWHAYGDASHPQVSARDGVFTIVWTDGYGRTHARRLDEVGDWIDASPRLVAEDGVVPTSLVATSGGYLLGSFDPRGPRGAEVIELDPTGVVTSRRAVPFEDGPKLACADPTGGPCLAVGLSGGVVAMLRMAADGQPLEPAPRPLGAFGGSPELGCADGVCLVASCASRDTRVVRVGVDGTILDASPIELPTLDDCRISVLPGDGGFLVSAFVGAPVHVAVDGSVSPSPQLVGPGASPLRGAFTGSRWLFAAARPVEALAMASDGTVERRTTLAERFATASDPLAAAGETGWLAAWRERPSSGVGYRARLTPVASDGTPGSPPFELGTRPGVAAALEAAGDRFVLYHWEAGRAYLSVFDAAGADLVGPVDLFASAPGWSAGTISLHCSPQACLLTRSGWRYDPEWRTFDPASGALGPVMPGPRHRVASGRAGLLHLETTPTGRLEARRLDEHGLPIDDPPLTVSTGSTWGVTADGTSTGWVIVFRRGGALRTVHVSSGGAVVDRGPDEPAIDGAIESLDCGDGGCWLRTDPRHVAHLTWLDADGRFVETGTVDWRAVQSLSVRDRSSTLMITRRSDLWPGRDADRLHASVIGGDRSPGDPCMLALECASGHCVDGVCCESACGGGADGDCEACAVASGGAEDGRCTPVAAAWTCREADGPCDVGEACDGTSRACPTDLLAPAATVCRPDAGPCDVAETCDGTDPSCPADAFISGFVCRPATTPCDAEETCDGTMALCPADSVRGEGEVCRAAVGDCDVAEACDGVGDACPLDARQPYGTSCGSDACGYDAFCVDGACVGTRVDCDDGDACTTDDCVAGRGCTHRERWDCCRDDAGCDDRRACTIDWCAEGVCHHSRRAGCCISDGECDDGVGCTTDRCVENVCVHEPCVRRELGGSAREVPPVASGCACSVRAPRQGAAAFWLAALLGLGARPRRRNRSASEDISA